MGFDGAAGRLVELGERERGAQTEAARALSPRDDDGGLEGFFRRRGAGGVALQQDIAARPVQFGFKCAKAMRSAVASPSSKGRESAVEIARCSLSLGQRNLQQPVEQSRCSCSRRLATPRRMFSRLLRRGTARSGVHPGETHRMRHTGPARAHGRGRRVKFLGASRAHGRRASDQTEPNAFFQSYACRHGSNARKPGLHTVR